MISVVIPCYNAQQYIERGLSWIKQYNPQIVEIIIVDDGSTDDSGKIIDSISDTYGFIKVFHTQNQGCAAAREILWYATQARESYPYYQHETIGYNYRMSNICAGIGRGQMTIADGHIAHHRHVQALYEELLKEVKGITMHCNPGPEYDSNYWLCAATLDPDLRIKG